jgi:hypothetical protein
MLIMILGG